MDMNTSKTKSLSGDLTTRQVPCESLCTEGEITGGLTGKLRFRLASQSPTDNPEVVTYTGSLTITTPEGSLSGQDFGVWNIANGECVDYTVFTSGTGALAGMRGSLMITGTFDLKSGTGRSIYLARLSPVAPAAK
jgi:hypothetical protein